MDSIRYKFLGKGLGVILFAMGAVPAQLSLAADNDSGPTQKQIDCQNQAVNDYYTELAGCESALSDNAGQLQQCKDDARSEMERDKSQCLQAARAGGSVGTSGAVLDRGTRPTVKKTLPASRASGGTLKQQ